MTPLSPEFVSSVDRTGLGWKVSWCHRVETFSVIFPVFLTWSRVPYEPFDRHTAISLWEEKALSKPLE